MILRRPSAWTEIGRSMGFTRQASRKRFSAEPVSGSTLARASHRSKILESGLGSRPHGFESRILPLSASSAVRILRCVALTAKRPLLLNIRRRHDRPTCGSLEGGSIMTSNDGGPQHSAGAQFADSIAVPGAAAVCKLRAGPSRFGRAELYNFVSGWLSNGAP
jgi:hypothetical protein